MADDGIWATNAQVLKECGENVNSTYSAVAYTDEYLASAEAYINCTCKFVFTAAVFAALTTGKDAILTRWSAKLAAMDVIKADLGGARILEFQTRLDVLNDQTQSIEKLMTQDGMDMVNWVNEA